MLFTVLFILSGSLTAQTPHQSFFEIPSSNGFGSVHYSFYDGDHKIAGFYPHIYKQYDAWTSETPNLMFDSYFGLRFSDSVWLNTVAESDVSYISGTGIIKVDQDYSGTENISVTNWIFSPFELDAAAYVMLLEIKGEAPPLAAFSLHNLRMGGGDGTENENIEKTDNGFIEYGENGYVVYYRPVSAVDGYLAAASGDNSPWSVMQNGTDFDQTSTLVSGNDLALGLQFNVPGGVSSGESTWVGIITASTRDGNVTQLIEKVESYVAARTCEDLLSVEQQNWNDFQARGTLPAGISTREEALARQGLAVLRFAQVREPNTEDGNPYGQILAALPKARPADGEGIWNVAWVRDASYGIVALAKTGYLEEARNALKFMLEADSGEYSQAVGYPYNISICRHYGSGREETDYNHQGPNIEFDDFGLFLWAFSETVKADPDNDWWTQYWDEIKELTADVLVNLTEKHTFLIAPDSSIWERHWNGNEKRFTYSTVMAVKGLCSISDLEDITQDSDVEKYRENVSRLLKGIRLNLVDTQNVLAGSMEELFSGENYLDLSAIEAFNFGIFPPSDPVTTASLQKYHDVFFDGVENSHGGYYRNDDGDWYDYQEWSFIDLRMSVALSVNNLTARRDALLEWVVSQSEANNNLMGELYCRGTENCPQRGDYRGSVPMIGFGPGSFILALDKRNNPVSETLCATPTDEDPAVIEPELTEGTDASTDPDSTTSEISPSGGGGCSCQSTNSESSFYFLFIIIGLALFTRNYYRKI
ncbi:MAG: hypothetical protein JXR95_05120 [Deltaproteobacteria bacterium]|nr:hypothetical protein [Deltaproteobacteria bacterium]